MNQVIPYDVDYPLFCNNDIREIINEIVRKKFCKSINVDPPYFGVKVASKTLFFDQSENEQQKIEEWVKNHLVGYVKHIDETFEKLHICYFCPRPQQGYGKLIIDYFKTIYKIITLDSVYNALVFYRRLGFVVETEDLTKKITEDDGITVVEINDVLKLLSERYGHMDETAKQVMNNVLNTPYQRDMFDQTDVRYIINAFVERAGYELGFADKIEKMLILLEKFFPDSVPMVWERPPDDINCQICGFDNAKSLYQEVDSKNVFCGQICQTIHYSS